MVVVGGGVRAFHTGAASDSSGEGHQAIWKGGRKGVGGRVGSGICGTGENFFREVMILSPGASPRLACAACDDLPILPEC